jgi:hypothetical protein
MKTFVSLVAGCVLIVALVPVAITLAVANNVVRRIGKVNK